MNDKEISGLIGSVWWRALNPFRSDMERVERATQGNPALRWRAGLALRNSSHEDAGLLIAYGFGISLLVSSAITCSVMDFKLLQGIIIGLAAFYVPIGIITAGFAGMKRQLRTIDAFPICKLTAVNTIKTGNPILDRLLDMDPFEAEIALTNGGMTAEEVKALVDLTKAISHIRSAHYQHKGLLENIQQSWDISPKAGALLSKVDVIIGGGGGGGQGEDTPLAITADPVTVLGHAGIDLRAMHSSRV